MKSLAFLKTHFINDFVLNEFDKLKNCDNENNKSVLFIDNHANILENYKLCDKQRGKMRITFKNDPIDCFVLDEENFAETGLPYNRQEPKNDYFCGLMWFFCDYPIYIMRNAYPDFDYYWQIESDVFMNGKRYSN